MTRRVLSVPKSVPTYAVTIRDLSETASIAAGANKGTCLPNGV